MKLQTFNNGKGLIYGNDAKRIGCDKEGILKIGSVEIRISTVAESIMPMLFNGSSGIYKATFTEKNGNVFDLGRVTIRGGRLEPPPETAVEFMELRCKLDAIEEMCNGMQQEILELKNIFDTNSLNFLIK